MKPTNPLERGVLATVTYYFKGGRHMGYKALQEGRGVKNDFQKGYIIFEWPHIML